MKKALLLLCLTVGLCLFAAALCPMRTLPFTQVPVLSDTAIDRLKEERTALPFDLLSAAACGDTLPRCKAEDTWYTPAIVDDITFTYPEPWQLIRTEPAETADGTACRFLLYSHAAYAECTLIETGLPILDIRLQQFDLDAQYLTSDRTPAAAEILSIDASGHLQRQTDRIEIKTRGGTSNSFPKKSYTVSFLDPSGRPGLRTPLGLPADEKFALNSLYEDESKIRDALSHALWSKIDPDDALRFTYAELLLNGTYYGLYGVHQIITEHAMKTAAGDTVFKIESGLHTDPATYQAEKLPNYEVAVSGSADEYTLLRSFFETLVLPVTSFPATVDMDNFTDFTVLMEVLAARDADLKNMVLTHRAAENRFCLTPWDMDQTFGLTWDIHYPRHTRLDADFARMRFTDPLYDQHVEPIDILYASCPDFADAVSTRYRELRKTVFTDDALLEMAAALYDPLTDCGARQRDAERWPNSAISEDNSFIEAFIPARMAFLDQEFALAD